MITIISTYGVNENLHTGDLVEYTEFSIFSKVCDRIKGIPDQIYLGDNCVEILENS
jgi:hypothetical protein